MGMRLGRVPICLTYHGKFQFPFVASNYANKPRHPPRPRTARSNSSMPTASGTAKLLTSKRRRKFLQERLEQKDSHLFLAKARKRKPQLVSRSVIRSFLLPE